MAKLRRARNRSDTPTSDTFWQCWEILSKFFTVKRYLIRYCVSIRRMNMMCRTLPQHLKTSKTSYLVKTQTNKCLTISPGPHQDICATV